MTRAADRAREAWRPTVTKVARLAGVAWRRAGVLGIALVALAGAAHAQERAAFDTSSDEGFARIVLAFEDEVPPYAVRSSTGVVVIDFDAAVDIDADALAAALPDYIAVARRDPDGRSLRFALVNPVSINTIEAGERLFVDLLPENWVGGPPGLPQTVIDELARRAEEAEDRRAERERQRRLAAAAPIDLRIATLPTFARLVFVWPDPVNARIERGYDTVRLHFEDFARLETAGFGSRLPDYVTGLSAENGQIGLEVRLEVDPRVTVRGFQEGATYVLDVSAPESGEPALEPGLPGLSAEARSGARFPGAADARPYDLPSGEPEGAPDIALDFQPLDMAERAEAAADEVDEAALEPITDWDAVVAADPEAVQAEARHFDSSVRLVFPFGEETPSAVFHYAGALWLVFDTPRAIDTRALARELDGLVRAVEVLRLGDPAVLRLELARPVLTTVSGRRTNWVITLGDTVLDPPRPLSVGRGVDPELGAVATIALPGAGTVHRLRDGESGDRLVAVTALPPAHGVVKPHRMVEMTVLDSRHGVAARGLADDLNVRLEDGQVVFARRGGLAVSWPEGDADYRPGRLDADEVLRPGFIDLDPDVALDPSIVHRLLNHRIRAAAEADERRRTPARLQFARALLATDLGAEALAQLRLIAADDPAVLRDPGVRALRGVAKTLMHRPEEALREFDMYGLSDSPDIALWRGLAHSQAGEWRAAAEAFRAGMPALRSYGSERRHRFGLEAARTALELGDTTTAATRLAMLGDEDDEPGPEIVLLRGRLAEEAGDADEALAAYDTVRREGGRADAAEASLRATVLRHRRGSLDADAAIEALETLAVTWRGDDIELLTLRHLADLYLDRGNPRRAFELMKTAAIVDPASPITRALQDDMNVAFETLFLEGDADELPAVEALALYYDYRELTPIGRRGDEMIRLLAERLIDIDLLDQAAELLAHQVEHRLRGAARAQVASRLALVHLMNREPAKALDVMARTRQAVLPQEIMNKRLEIEARALSETGRTDLALDILGRLAGEPGIERLRADTLWRGERWRAAGEALERMLVEAGSADGQTLEAQAGLDVLRAGIAYALAEDRLGLDRLRTRFLAQMAESEHARAFDVVTSQLPEQGGAFEALVRDIAAIDTLDAFVAEYRARHGGPIGETASPES